MWKSLPHRTLLHWSLTLYLCPKKMADAPGMKSAARYYFPLLLAFILINGTLITSRSFLEKWKVDQEVLILGNLILFAATALSLYFYLKSLRSGKGMELLKYVYAGTFTKLLVCIFAVFPYIIVAGKQVNKPALMVCALFYFIYSALEVSTLLKHNKQAKNAQAGSPS